MRKKLSLEYFFSKKFKITYRTVLVCREGYKNRKKTCRKKRISFFCVCVSKV